MKDRVPAKPGRVLITPENGATAFYATMTRADDPTQEGDPLNKRTFLTDATAALFGLGTNAVPNDVLQVLSRFHARMGNEHIWKRTLTLTEEVPAHYELGEHRTGDIIMSQWDSTISQEYVTVSDSVLVNDTTGEVSMVDATKVLVYFGSNKTETNKEIISGKFLTLGYDIVYAPENVVARWSSPNIYVDGLQMVYGHAKVEAGTYIDYVNSPDQNAYPPAVDDGYIYEYLGQLGEKTRIATGSYTGTGTFSNTASKRCSLIFDFEPKFLSVASDTYAGMSLVLAEGVALVAKSNNTSYDVYVRKNGKEVYWYSTSDAIVQSNVSGKKYYYIAIG